MLDSLTSTYFITRNLNTWNITRRDITPLIRPGRAVNNRDDSADKITCGESSLSNTLLISSSPNPRYSALSLGRCGGLCSVGSHFPGRIARLSSLSDVGRAYPQSTGVNCPAPRCVSRLSRNLTDQTLPVSLLLLAMRLDFRPPVPLGRHRPLELRALHPRS